MRSQLVFEAVHTLRNRYTLCQLASKATRKFHKPSTRIQDTTNEVLNHIAESERQEVIQEPEIVAEAQRRAYAARRCASATISGSWITSWRSDSAM